MLCIYLSYYKLVSSKSFNTALFIYSISFEASRTWSQGLLFTCLSVSELAFMFFVFGGNLHVLLWRRDCSRINGYEQEVEVREFSPLRLGDNAFEAGEFGQFTFHFTSQLVKRRGVSGAHPGKRAHQSQKNFSEDSTKGDTCIHQLQEWQPEMAKLSRAPDLTRRLSDGRSQRFRCQPVCSVMVVGDDLDELVWGDQWVPDEVSIGVLVADNARADFVVRGELQEVIQIHGIFVWRRIPSSRRLVLVVDQTGKHPEDPNLAGIGRNRLAERAGKNT